MSLRIWLPLNGDLKNQGISEATVVNYNATVDSNGKTGSCYAFDGISQYLKINNFNIDAWPQMSIMFWSNNGPQTAFTLKSGTSSSGSMQFRSTANNSFYFRDKQHSSEIKVTLTTVIPENTWAHYAFIYNEGSWKAYINGLQCGEFNASTPTTLNSNNQLLWIFNGSTSSTSVFKAGKINDFRIYDHCLSPLEVKEISQGLVLHYQLSYRNLLLTDTERTITLGTDVTNAYSSYWYIDRTTEPAFCENTYVTITYNYQVNTLTSTSAYLYSQLNGTRLSPAISQTKIRNSAQGYVMETFKVTAAQATYSSSYRLRLRFYGNPGDSITISNIRMYFGTSENLLTAKDSSGYGHNGEIVNNLIISSNTPRYDTSAYFSNSSYIKTTNFNFPTNIWTASCWYYRDINPSAYETIFCLSKGNGSDANKKIAAIPNAGCIWFKGESGSLSISKLNISSWTMLTMTCDGTTVKVYENSSLIGSFEASTQMTECTDLVIGARSNSSNVASIAVPYTGGISDFRIYCTQLLDNDIKALYNIGMRVDNLGEIHANNFKEQNNNLFRTELIQSWANDTNIGHGEIVMRNDVPAIRINPRYFWHNIDAETSGFLVGAFKADTSYKFDLWVDNEDSLSSSGNGVLSGFYIYFSDGTTNNTFVKTGGTAGWQHFCFITPENKTITKLHVQYATNTPVFYRYDSYICEADKTSINLINVQTPQLKENHTSASIADKGAIYSTNFIEI